MEAKSEALFRRILLWLLIAMVILGIIAVAAVKIRQRSSPALSDQQAVISKSGKQLYQCPMHPQIIRDQPGTCPICGMELVPMKQKTK
jgi:hypothetical protein